MKNGYLTQKQIDEITAAIFNDTLPSIYEDLPEDTVLSVDRELIEAAAQGEEYVQIEKAPYYILTQSGRIINTRKVKALRPTYGGKDLFIYLYGNTRVDWKPLYEQKGWKYNIKDIIRNYKKNNWHIHVVDSGKVVFDQL